MLCPALGLPIFTPGRQPLLWVPGTPDVPAWLLGETSRADELVNASAVSIVNWRFQRLTPKPHFSTQSLGFKFAVCISLFSPKDNEGGKKITTHSTTLTSLQHL